MTFLKINHQTISFGYGPSNGLNSPEEQTQKWILKKNIQGYFPIIGNISGIFRTYHFWRLHKHTDPSLEATRIKQIRRGLAEALFCGLGLALIDLAATVHRYAKKLFCSFSQQHEGDASLPRESSGSVQKTPSFSCSQPQIEPAESEEDPEDHPEGQNNMNDTQTPTFSSPRSFSPSSQSPGATPKSQNGTNTPLWQELADQYAALDGYRREGNGSAQALEISKQTTDEGTDERNEWYDSYSYLSY